MICDVKNIANEGKAFWTWWKSTEGLLSESSYEPEDEANEGNRSESEFSHEVAVTPRNPSRTSDSRVRLSTHTEEGGLHPPHNRAILK